MYIFFNTFIFYINSKSVLKGVFSVTEQI